MDSILARLDALINNDEGSTRNGRGPHSASAHDHPGMSGRDGSTLEPEGSWVKVDQRHLGVCLAGVVWCALSRSAGTGHASQANAQMALIDFDPTALGFDPNTILDSQAPFDWEVYLSEMYNEGNLFMN
jgi:hypothetical protein